MPDGGTFGITGTPVIDVPSNLLYAVGSILMNGNVVEYDLFAVNILNGQVMGTIKIDGSVTGKAPDAQHKCTSTFGTGGTGPINFDANHRQRAALLLLNHNMVYVAFAPGGGAELPNGWLFGYQFVPSGNSGTFNKVSLSTPLLLAPAAVYGKARQVHRRRFGRTERRTCILPPLMALSISAA